MTEPVPASSPMSSSITGLELSDRFYRQIVRPILRRTCPSLRYSAALIGPGSEVLGYDDEMSRDHHWGPRLLLFVADADVREQRSRIGRTLSRTLPPMFLGYSTNFGPPDAHGVRLPRAARDQPIDHMVEVHGVQRWFRKQLGFDPAGAASRTQWLRCPQQRLLEVTSGEVFHDGLRQLRPLRRRVAFFPRDIWMEMLAAKWDEIGAEEPFVGRSGERNDDLGSRLIAARQAHRMMELCFLMERRYAPYSKWFGTAFRHLRCAQRIGPALMQALSADGWHSRESALCLAARRLAVMHNHLKLTPPVQTAPSRFHDRPYRVIHADTIARAIRHQASRR